MERKITIELENWKSNPNKKPLMVLGCRQVGKTYSIRQFLKKTYQSYMEINFERDLKFREIFKGDLDAKSLIDKVIILSNVHLIPGKSAIFLDEIQACAGAYSALKWLHEDGRFDIIVSGSFLGVRLKGEADEPASPLGYVDTLFMYPMDFEEYLWAMGVDRRIPESVRQSLQSETEIDPAYHKLLNEHFKRYLIVGGMPDAVHTYAETQDYFRVRKVLGSILDILKDDAGKYSEKKTDRMKILACMDSIPAQLASDKRRFQYADIEKKTGGIEKYGYAVEWLINAGMAYRCYNLTSVDPPLPQNIKESMFKVYFCDTGLLMGFMDQTLPGEIITQDPFVNKGVIMENAVAAALAKKGYALRYYAKTGSTLEVDFVIDLGYIALFEVKSGQKKRSKSLNVLLGEKNCRRKGYKICDGNVSKDENGAIHVPMYAVCFLQESRPASIAPVDVKIPEFD